MSTMMIVVAVVVLAIAILVIRYALAAWQARGQRLVTCPETRETVAVDVDTTTAALAETFTGHAKFELTNCTRWPERKDCGRECLSQIEDAPENCLVRNILAAWYADKDCAVCKTPLGPVEWHDHKPALMDAGGRTLEWSDIPPEQIPEFLSTHQPVCWNCHVAESFRRLHPDLVTDRPWREPVTREAAKKHSAAH